MAVAQLNGVGVKFVEQVRYLGLLFHALSNDDNVTDCLSSSIKTRLTTLVCIRADGAVMPPFVLLLGKSVNTLRAGVQYSYLDFGLKTAVFGCLTKVQSSSADCAKELLNDSNRSASLLTCTRKKNFLVWWVRIFSE